MSVSSGGLHRPDDRLSAKRKARCSRRQALFSQAFQLAWQAIPRVINVDKNLAYPAAISALKRGAVLPRRVCLRLCKFLNNVVQQDRRVAKKRTWLAKGYGAFHRAWRTLEGIRNDAHMI